ncbi:MAG: hypothetical protein JF607_25920 [Burkholderiales bacterium]|nr:hypothetical protein [Burkholderiales bacterium]MBW8894122.1 hypothetical protein [Burkholderiales bacterium]
MPFDALGAAPPPFNADAGTAHDISVKAMHDTSPDMKTAGDLDPCCMTLHLSD